jgi:hypothetical protein
MTALGLVQQEPPDPDDNGLPVGAKLAGNQISNFGAFLSARWRLNDWTWGRMDAAQSLVEVVTLRSPDPARPDPIPALREAYGPGADSSPDEVRAEIVRRLHDRILREELPVLKELSDRPPEEDLTPAAFGPEVDLRPGVRQLLAIGAEKPQNLLPRNVPRLADLARLAGVGGYAFGSGHLVRLTTRLRKILPF